MSDSTERAAVEKAFYESTVHGLRSQGWSRVDAEDEALERIDRLRGDHIKGDSDHE